MPQLGETAKGLDTVREQTRRKLEFVVKGLAAGTFDAFENALKTRPDDNDDFISSLIMCVSGASLSLSRVTVC